MDAYILFSYLSSAAMLFFVGWQIGLKKYIWPHLAQRGMKEGIYNHTIFYNNGIRIISVEIYAPNFYDWFDAVFSMFFGRGKDKKGKGEADDKDSREEDSQQAKK